MVKPVIKSRQKIVMKKIEKKTHRSVTFTKRRAGLFKKAHELITLCGAKLAILAFSPGDKAFSFGHPNVNDVLDRFTGGYTKKSNGDHNNPITKESMDSYRSKIEDLMMELKAAEMTVEAERALAKELRAQTAQSNANWDQLTYPQMLELLGWVKELQLRITSAIGECNLQERALDGPANVPMDNNFNPTLAGQDELGLNNVGGNLGPSNNLGPYFWENVGPNNDFSPNIWENHGPSNDFSSTFGGYPGPNNNLGPILGENHGSSNDFSPTFGGYPGPNNNLGHNLGENLGSNNFSPNPGENHGPSNDFSPTFGGYPGPNNNLGPNLGENLGPNNFSSNLGENLGPNNFSPNSGENHGPSNDFSPTFGGYPGLNNNLGPNLGENPGPNNMLGPYFGEYPGPSNNYGPNIAGNSGSSNIFGPNLGAWSF